MTAVAHVLEPGDGCTLPDDTTAYEELAHVMDGRLADAAAALAYYNNSTGGPARCPATGGGITMLDEFCGIGGWTFAGQHVPGVEVAAGANHSEHAMREWSRNNPAATPYLADITKLQMTDLPRVDLYLGSPACPGWSDARGVTRDFDLANAVQEALFDMPGAHWEDPAFQRRVNEHKRSRLLMWEIVVYLRAMIARDPANPVLIGAFENVVQCRKWRHWDYFVRQFDLMGYDTKLIPFDASHASPVRMRRSAQSRKRLFFAFWHRSIGRAPDWRKWLAPQAWCDLCGETVLAEGPVFKDPRNDMGLYGSQYYYVCPRKHTEERGHPVVPDTLPALSALDLSLPIGTIGDRERLGLKVLVKATRDRVQAGIRQHWAPLLADAGPGEGAWMQPFIATIRGGGSKLRTHLVTDPAGTVSTSGRNHALAVAPPALLMRNNSARGDAGHLSSPVTEPARTLTTAGHQSLLVPPPPLLVPYYSGSKTAVPATRPSGALTTRDTYGLASVTHHLTRLPTVDEVLYRMLAVAEIEALMGFDGRYPNLAPSDELRRRLYGNAIVPAVGELIISALVECLTGEALPRENFALAA